MSGDADKVESFLRARAGGPAFMGVPPGHRPRTEADGYRLQSAIHAQLARTGVVRCGYKIGSISAAGQRAFGLSEPVYAGIFETTRFASLAEALRIPMVAPSVECEIAVRLQAPLDGANPALSLEQVGEAIELCQIACEVIDNRYGDPLSVGIPTLLVDDFFHLGFVLGPPVTDWRRLDLANLDAMIRVRDSVHRANSASVLNPLQATLWLARKLAAAGIILQPGEIVLTGSIVPPTAIPHNIDRLALAIEGLGALTLPE
jgi:2-keto-4-pentenoate hydratase